MLRLLLTGRRFGDDAANPKTAAELICPVSVLRVALVSRQGPRPTPKKDLRQLFPEGWSWRSEINHKQPGRVAICNNLRMGASAGRQKGAEPMIFR